MFEETFFLFYLIIFSVKSMWEIKNEIKASEDWSIKSNNWKLDFKGVFTLSIDVSKSINAWKEKIDFYCIIHTKHQHEGQH